MLYSSFVHLLDTGRVRAARLESGTSRLYFDLRPRDTAATTTAATTTAEATPTTSPATTPTATAAASATAAAASAQPAAAPASSQLVPAMRFQRQFVVKLAEKTDPALVSRVLMAGVEFGVLRQVRLLVGRDFRCRGLCRCRGFLLRRLFVVVGW